MKKIMFLLLTAGFLITNCGWAIQALALEEAEAETVDIYDAMQADETMNEGEIIAKYSGLCYSYLELDQVPVLSVYKEDGEYKSLLIFLHGLGSKKESLLPVLSAYAEAGYYAVAIDAYDHGARCSNEMYCDMWASMLLTVRDVDRVIGYFEDVPEVDTDNFVLGGFSMGSIETCIYAEIGERDPSALMSFSGLCEYDAWQPAVRTRLSYMWLKPWKSSVWAFTERQEPTYSDDKFEMIRSMDVTDNLSSFDGIPIFISIGDIDTYFCASNIKSVAETIEENGNEKVTFIAYTNIGHELTEKMIEDSISFLSENI